jgi:alkylated DNA repair dioxygenase AlkB
MKIDYLDSKSIVIYQPNFLNQNDYLDLQEWLETQKFETGTTISGNLIDREQIWFQEQNKYFCPLWKRRHQRWESKDYIHNIQHIQQIIQKHIDNILTTVSFTDFNLTPTTINSCLVNKYQDGNSCITPHSDSTLSFGNRPLIVGLSIGDTRKIVFRKKKCNQIKEEFLSNPIVLERELVDNSIFIMAGDSQIKYTHEIPKEENKKKRYSLTFRQMIL